MMMNLSDLHKALTVSSTLGVAAAELTQAARRIQRGCEASIRGILNGASAMPLDALDKQIEDVAQRLAIAANLMQMAIGTVEASEPLLSTVLHAAGQSDQGQQELRLLLAAGGQLQKVLHDLVAGITMTDQQLTSIMSAARLMVSNSKVGAQPVDQVYVQLLRRVGVAPRVGQAGDAR